MHHCTLIHLRLRVKTRIRAQRSSMLHKILVKLLILKILSSSKLFRLVQNLVKLSILIDLRTKLLRTLILILKSKRLSMLSHIIDLICGHLICGHLLTILSWLVIWITS